MFRSQISSLKYVLIVIFETNQMLKYTNFMQVDLVMADQQVVGILTPDEDIIWGFIKYVLIDFIHF